MEESDHVPILIRLNGEEEVFKRPFRFLQAWTTDKRSFRVVKDAWEKRPYFGMEQFKTFSRLRSTARALRVWNREEFGIANIRIKELEERLRSTQVHDDNTGDLFNAN